MKQVEWPTLGVIAVTYGVWLGALWLPWWLAIPVLALAIAQHGSLQHETIHGHPFPVKWGKWANAALMAPSLWLAIPYLRFYDTHLAHHRDARLTDPLEDPESHFLDQARWDRLPGRVQRVLLWNNTLLGRMVLGPAISQLAFVISDGRAMVRGAHRVTLAWALHVPAVAVVLAVVWAAPLPIWAYLIAAYVGLSLLKIRTFAEHQAHEASGARSVIIEDRGILAFLFLNNNLHVVHHMHPSVPWYALPAKFRAGRDLYLRRNKAYYFGSYKELFTQFALRRKDPVAHPLWHRTE